jgi:hypothetical protein
MARKPQDPSDEPTRVAATVTLALGRTKATHSFESIAVSTEDPQHVTVALSSVDGKRIDVRLPRSEVKRLLTWRMIMGL